MAETYLDHAATTPMRPAALEAQMAVLRDEFGNPSGAHAAARRARRLVDDARDVVAAAVGAEPDEIVFTSGGTEADNLAVAGADSDAHAAVESARTVLASAVEHPAVLEPVQALDGELLPVDRHGAIELDALADRLARAADGTARGVRLVSIMAANNENGTLNDLASVAAVIAEAGERAGGGAVPLLHTDAVAAASWIDMPDMLRAADLITVSGHKVGGPKGVGALVVRRGTRVRPMLLGGGQERERRAGTPDVAGIVGFATALSEAVATRRVTVARAETLRGRLIEGLDAVDGLEILSAADPTRRTAGTVHLGIRGVDREALVFLLDRAGIAVSWGSSCASGASEPSHVLAAAGVDRELAAGALRISLGWCSTGGDVDHLLSVLPEAVVELRAGG